MYLNGKEVHFKGPKDAQAAGIAAVYQHPTSYPELSVTENIFMGHEMRKYGMIQWNLMNQETWTITYAKDDVRETPAKLSFDKKGIVKPAE